MPRPVGCRCKPGILTCWYCVDNRRWEKRFQERHGEAERAYYAQRRDPFALGSRTWYGDSDDDAIPLKGALTSQQLAVATGIR